MDPKGQANSKQDKYRNNQIYVDHSPTAENSQREKNTSYRGNNDINYG